MTEFRVGDRVMARGVVTDAVNVYCAEIAFDGDDRGGFVLLSSALTPDPAPPAAPVNAQMLNALRLYDEVMVEAWGDPSALAPEHGDARRVWPTIRAAIAAAEQQSTEDTQPPEHRQHDYELGWEMGFQAATATSPTAIPEDLAAELRRLAADYPQELTVARGGAWTEQGRISRLLRAADRAGILAPVEREASTKATPQFEAAVAAWEAAAPNEGALTPFGREALRQAIDAWRRTALDAGVIR